MWLPLVGCTHLRHAAYTLRYYLLLARKLTYTHRLAMQAFHGEHDSQVVGVDDGPFLKGAYTKSVCVGGGV